jgi:hypothetical protein
MLQHDKLHQLLHRDVDGRESRRSLMVNNSALHRRDSSDISLERPNPSTLSNRRSISAFGGAEDLQINTGGYHPTGGVRRAATLTQATSNALSVAANNRPRGTQRSNSGDRSPAPAAASTTGTAATAGTSSHAIAAESTIAPPAPSSSSGRLKVRPTVRSWKHTKATAQEDSLSNLALLAQRYKQAAAANAAAKNAATLLESHSTQPSRQDGSAPSSDMHSSADVSDHEASDAAGGHTDDDVSVNGDDSAPPKPKRGGVGSRIKANLQKKGTTIRSKFRDIANNFTGNKSKGHSLPSASSNASNSQLATSTQLESRGSDDADEPSSSTATGKEPMSSSLQMSPNPMSPSTDGTDDVNVTKLSLNDNNVRSLTPLAHLREHDQKQLQAAAAASLLAKDSAHWKPRSSAADLVGLHGFTNRRDSTVGLDDSPPALRMHLNGQPHNMSNGVPSASPTASTRSGIYSPTGERNSPPPFLRALTSPQRPGPLTTPTSITSNNASNSERFGSTPASTALLATLSSPVSKRATIDNASSTPLFLRKSSNATPLDIFRRDPLSSSALDTLPSGVPGGGYRDRSASTASALGITSPLGSPEGAKEIASLRQLIHQHGTDLEMQIADSQSHTLSHTHSMVHCVDVNMILSCVRYLVCQLNQLYLLPI